MPCPNCGGELQGDGYGLAVHCERVDLPADVEADSGPYFCGAEWPGDERLTESEIWGEP